jgi:hypothetical protein
MNEPTAVAAAAAAIWTNAEAPVVNAEAAAVRRRTAMADQVSGKRNAKCQAGAPPRHQRHFCHRMALDGVDHPVRRDEDRAVLGGRIVIEREQEEIARRRFVM